MTDVMISIGGEGKHYIFLNSKEWTQCNNEGIGCVSIKTQSPVQISGVN